MNRLLWLLLIEGVQGRAGTPDRFRREVDIPIRGLDIGMAQNAANL